MRRFLQLARSVPLTQAFRSDQLSYLTTHQQACRPLTISCVVRAKRSDSINEEGSNRGGRKRGFLERASDKLSEMSGLGSPSGQKSSTSARQTRSMTQSGSSSFGRSRGDDVSGKGSKKAGGKFGSHRSMNSVKHDKESHRFTLDLGGNKIARIDYRPIGKNMIEMYHTEVPEELRGRGIGKALAKGALECALRANIKLKVTCEYLEDYVNRLVDEKYRKLITK